MNKTMKMLTDQSVNTVCVIECDKAESSPLAFTRLGNGDFCDVTKFGKVLFEVLFCCVYREATDEGFVYRFLGSHILLR